MEIYYLFKAHRRFDDYFLLCMNKLKIDKYLQPTVAPVITDY